jgi:valyl-tRNA synthetase
MRLNEVIKKVTDNLEGYQFSEAGMAIYDFFWGEYCDWYVEMSKVKKNEQVLKHVLTTALKLLHPFMPFVTESIWQNTGKGMLITAEWPTVDPRWNFENESAEMGRVMELVTAIRSLRAEANVDATKKIHAIVYAHEDLELIQDKAEIIKRLANLGTLEISETGDKVEKSLTCFVGDLEVYLPLAELIDMDAEKKRLQKEVDELEQFAKSLEAKLSNEAFVKNAPPAIVEKEQARLVEVKAKSEKLKAQLEELSKT